MRPGKWSVALVAVASAVLVPAMPASAATPAVSLTVAHRGIDVGQGPTFSWTASGLPSGSTLYLQRQFGTQNVWKNVEQLPGLSGTVVAPRLTTLGAYYYRVHVVHNGALVKNSRQRLVYAYGKVSLKKLCTVSQGFTCDAGSDGGSVEVGSTIFTYQIKLETAVAPSWQTQIRYLKTSCRSLSIQYAADANGQAASDTEHVRVLQASADPVSSSAAAGTVGHLTVKLDGGAWNLDLSSDNFHDNDMTGSASCWSANGKG